MQDLIKSYRTTIRDTERMLEIKILQAEAHKEKIEDEKKDSNFFLVPNCPHEDDIKILRSMLSSMRLALSILNKDMRIKKQSFAKLTKEQREISFDPQWISRREDARAEIYEPDDLTLENQLEVQNQKARLVKSMTASLTQRQKEILEMVSNGYTHQEIADVLDVQASTISNTIAQIRDKIKKEGWFMI